MRGVLVLALFFSLWFLLKIDSSLIYIPTSLTSLHFSKFSPSLPFLPRYTPSSYSLQKRAVLQERTIEQDLKRHNKTREKPSYWGWTRKPNIRKRVSEVGRICRDTLTPPVRSSTKATITAIINMQRTWWRAMQVLGLAISISASPA